MSLFSFSMFLLVLLVSACSNAQDSSDSQTNNQFNIEDSVVKNFELTDDRTEQEKALDALNEIQMSGSGKLYSTFANITHSECEGAIKNYVISSVELETVLLELLDEYCPNLSSDQRSYLASTSAKAQGEYELTTCGSIVLLTDTTINPKLPHNGTWIFPAVLDQRDVIIVW